MSAAVLVAGCGRSHEIEMKELQKVRAGGFEIVLLSPGDALHTGKSSAILEFRAPNGVPVDAGEVTVSATMPMAGMAPMIAGSEVKPTSVPGRYEVETDFSMVGTWRIDVRWDGPTGKGTASLPGAVQ